MRGRRKLLELMAMFVILIVVMVSKLVCADVRKDPTVHLHRNANCMSVTPQ